MTTPFEVDNTDLFPATGLSDESSMWGGQLPEGLDLGWLLPAGLGDLNGMTSGGDQQ